MNSSQFNKILVVKHGSLGDIAFSIHAMGSIKQFFNNATIDLLTEEKYRGSEAGILKANTYKDKTEKYSDTFGNFI